MSDQVRVRLDAPVTPETVAEALGRVTGETVAVRADARTPGIVMFHVGEARFQHERPALVHDAGDGEAEVSVYACDPGREMMRALAADLGGRYRGSDYDAGWETLPPPGPGR